MSDSLKAKFEEKIRRVEPDRVIGLFGATTIGVGALMGAGVYVLIGIASGSSGPSIWLSYIICGLLAYLTTLLFADMSKGYAVGGGAYAFAYKTLGSIGGFSTGWFLALGSIFACALYAVGFAQYSVSLIGFELPKFVVKFVGIALVIVGTLMNSLGSGGSARTQNILTWGNLAILVVFIASCLFFFEPSNMKPMFPKGISGTMGAIGIIYISFFGYQLIANNADEIKDPSVTIPKAMKLSMLIAFAFYLMVAVVAVLVIPWQQLASSDAPMVLVAEKSLGSVGFYLISVGGILASASALNSTLLSQSRQIFAMGKNRFLPDLIGELDKKFKSPRNAVMVGGLLVSLAILFLDLEFIAKSANFCLLASFLPVSLAMAKLYRTHPERRPGSLFRRFLPEITLVVNVALLLNLGLVSLAFGQQLALIGAAVYFFYSRKRESRSKAGLNVALTDQKRFLIDTQSKVLVPMANPSTQEAILSISNALLREEGGEIVALSIVKAPGTMDFYDALSSADQSLEIIERSAELSKDTNVPVKPVIRASRDLAEGVIFGAEESGCDLVIMGMSKDQEFMDRILELSNTDIIFLNLLESTGLFNPQTIGIHLTTQTNLEMMVKLGNALALKFGAEICYFSILESGYSENSVARQRDLLVESLRKHQPKHLFSARLIEAENSDKGLMNQSEKFDFMVLGARPVRLLGRTPVDEDYLSLIGKLKCSTATVRMMPRVRKIFKRI